MVQRRSSPHHRARVIATNNVLNALFMVASALGTVGMLYAGFGIPLMLKKLGHINSVVVMGTLFMLLLGLCSGLWYGCVYDKGK
jgi:1,4-dihydroxy-2-naphthoate octaprenyltransferase